MVWVRRLRGAVKLAVVGVVAAAVVQELAKPAAERTWHGRVLGVPYDFRVPTAARIRQAYWNPEDPRLFTERVVGVGWAVNLYRARELLERAFGTLTTR
jgi:Family of unknown function (DUF5808)